MLMGVRMYTDEQHARDAAAALVAAGLSRKAVNVLVPSPGQEAQIVRSAIDDRRLPGSHVHVATDALRRGRTVLSVDLPYESQVAIEIMERYGPVESDKLPSVPRRNPAPLSDLLGIRVLLHDRGTTQLVTGRNRFIFPNFFGLPLLTKPVAGKEKSFGFPLLKEPVSKKEKSFGFALLKEPVSKKEKSFGIPLLSRKNPAPLSSLLGLKTLKDSRKDRRP